MAGSAKPGWGSSDVGVRNLSFSRMTGIAIAAIGWVALAPSMAQGQELKLPLYSGDAHVGVTSCSGSTCHGAVEPFKGSNVLQNEFVTWQRDDKHSQAYAVLQNARSQRIARNLGLENAHTAKMCLDCHADNIGADSRGRQFQLSDGVGCEACHGGARRWLGTHVSGATHDENVKAGLYPTDQAVPRARLCLSCHFGVSSKTKFVTHQIMGAGHPRMPFELDTFTTIQPAHYVADEDYRKRKASPSGVQVWALGQSMAMAAMLESVLDGDRNRSGVFPELVTFDCHACHHQMSQEIDLRWRARKGVGLPPGMPRFNDANLVMMRIIASRIDPALGGRLSTATVAFHKSTLENFDRYQARARELLGVVNEMVRKVSGRGFSKDDMQAILTGLVTDGANGELFDYASAEQATMALGSVISSMRQAGAIETAQLEKLNAQLERCYAATADDELYRPADFAAAIGGFRDLIR